MGFCSILLAQNPNCLDLRTNSSIDYKNIFIMQRHYDTLWCDSNYQICIPNPKKRNLLIHCISKKPIVVKDSSYNVEFRFEQKCKFPTNSVGDKNLEKIQFFGNSKRPYTGPSSFYTSLFFGQKLVLPIDHNFSNNIILDSLAIYIAFAQYKHPIELRLQVYQYDGLNTYNSKDLLEIIKYKSIFFEDSLRIESGKGWYGFNFNSLVLPSHYLIVFYLPKNNLYDDLNSDKVNMIGIGTYRFPCKKNKITTYKSNYIRVLDSGNYVDLWNSLELFREDQLAIFLKYEIIY